MWYPYGIKKETFHSCVFKSRSCLCNCRRWDMSSKPFSIFLMKRQLWICGHLHQPCGTTRAHTHIHTHTHARMNYVTVYDVIQGPSRRAEGVKGSKGSALPRVVIAPERVRRKAREDRWHHSGKSIPGATSDVTCRMGVDWRQQWRKQLRDLP